MIKRRTNEEWKEVPFSEGAVTRRYAISNLGRVASFKEDLHKDGKILKGSVVGGYVALKVNPDKQSKTLYLHRLVADQFLDKKGEQDYVIHKDFNKANNRVDNLAWATREEMNEHQTHNPAILDGRRRARMRKPVKGQKLNYQDVMRLKKRIFDPKRKESYRQIAQEFNISEMQLYRIKRGDNWSHIDSKKKRPQPIEA